MSDEEHGKAIDKTLFPGMQGGPLMHVIAGKAVALGEALTPEYRTYIERVIENARVLAETLQSEGLRIVSGGTDNHLMLVDLTSLDMSGRKAERLLDAVGITANKNTIPGDTAATDPDQRRSTRLARHDDAWFRPRRDAQDGAAHREGLARKRGRKGDGVGPYRGRGTRLWSAASGR